MRCIAAFLVLSLGVFPLAGAAGKAPNRLVVVVIGDSLADGLWASLYWSFIRFRDVKIVRETRNSSGFTNYNWQARLRGILRRHPNMDAAVIQLGANDRQWIRAGRGDRPLFGTERWQEVYRAKVERFIRTLTDRRIAVFWVGLPIMRRKKVRADTVLINRIFRDAAVRQRATFVPTWSVLANAKGDYVTFIRDRRGRWRRLRHRDGIHSSPIGYGRVGREVIKALRRELPEMPPARR